MLCFDIALSLSKWTLPPKNQFFTSNCVFVILSIKYYSNTWVIIIRKERCWRISLGN